MNKDVAKQEILRTALHSIYLDGIRATKVDDIAASLSISKRTLYELYPSKSDLIQACVRKMEKEWMEQINRLEASTRQDALVRIWKFVEIYLDNLYQTRLTFWHDLIRDESLKEWRDANRQEWIRRLSDFTRHSQQEGFLLKEMNAALFSDCLLTGIFQSRIDYRPYEKQYAYSYIMVRGASTPAGIRRLDKIIDLNDVKKKEYPLLCR